MVPIQQNLWHQDGRANISNTLGITKIRQATHDQFDVDLRTEKAKIIHNTNTYIKENYGEKVTITTGHSQGSRDSTQAKRSFFPEAESIVFQPAPGGEVTQHEGRMFTTPNDGVSLKGKALAAVHPNYDMNYTQSTDKSKLNTLTGGHMLDHQSVSVPTVVGEDMSVKREASHTQREDYTFQKLWKGSSNWFTSRNRSKFNCRKFTRQCDSRRRSLSGKGKER